MNTEPIFHYDPWNIRETEPAPDRMADSESVFALANGYLGMRGTMEEMTYAWCRGTYLNGFFETRPIRYGEKFCGYPEEGQSILNAADGRKIRLRIDEEEFDLTRGTVRSWHRELDMREGLLRREILWESPGGKVLRIESERLVSFRRRHIAALRYRVTLVEGRGTLGCLSTLDGNVTNLAAEDDPRVGAHLGKDALVYGEGTADPERGELTARTGRSGLTLACGVSHRAAGLPEGCLSPVSEHREVGLEMKKDMDEGESVMLDKFLSYSCGKISDETGTVRIMREELDKARRDGFDALKKEQSDYLEDFWKHADVVIEGDDALQQGIRFNLFHLLQSAGRYGRTSIAAKGLTGEGYEGHFFWDTEIYVLPLFTYSQPAIAKSLLEYRYSTLDRARERAAELSQKGALYPWRTIDGREASPYFPAGTAQYHINADIAYGIKKYLQITGDREFLPRAVEILIETARLWADLGDYIPGRDSRFCINGVTGPDEYTTLVNNNYYTNVMVKDQLEFTLRALEMLRQSDSEACDDLIRRTDLKEEEPGEWQRAADRMYLPYDEALGVHPQDDSFLSKKVWPIKEIPAEKRPLLLHYHPLVINRYQILKQADLVLALFLQGNRFTREEKRRDFLYYDPLTTGDSSLSACVQSVIAAETGFDDLAFDYFRRTARTDLDDVQGNVRDGLHMAAMAGTWTSIIYGFAGMRDYEGELSFTPRLPRQWDRLSFHLTVRGRLLEVDLSPEEAVYTLKEGDSLTFTHRGEEQILHAGSPLNLPIGK